MADRVVRNKATGRTMSESELYKYELEWNPAVKQMTPQQIVDNYLNDPEYELVDLPNSTRQFAGNVVKSAGNVIADYATGAYDAARVGLSLPDMALSKMGAGNIWWKPEDNPSMAVMSAVTERPKETAQALGAHYKGKYIDNLGRTLYEDPVGVISDASALLGIGSGLVRAATKLPAVGTKAMQAAKALEAASTVTNPTAAVTKVPLYLSNKVVPEAKKAIAGMRGVQYDPGQSKLQAAGERLYGGVLNPTTSTASAESQRAMLREMMKNEIPLSTKGQGAIDAIIKDIDEHRSFLVAEMEATGKTIDPIQALDHVAQYKGKVMGRGRPVKPTVAVDLGIMEFLEQHTGARFDRKKYFEHVNTDKQFDPFATDVMLKTPGSLKPTEAQRIISETYGGLNEGAYSKKVGGDPDPVQTSIDKSIASGLKAERDKMNDALRDMGLKEHNLREGRKQMDRFVKQYGAKSIMSQSFYSLMQMVRTFFTQSVNASGGAGWMRTIADTNPELLSRMALSLSRDYITPAKRRNRINVLAAAERAKGDILSSPMDEPPIPPEVEAQYGRKPIPEDWR